MNSFHSYTCDVCYSRLLNKSNQPIYILYMSIHTSYTVINMYIHPTILEEKVLKIQLSPNHKYDSAQN